MSSGRPKWSKNKIMPVTPKDRFWRKKHDITLKFYIGPQAMVREPWCQSGWILEKKKKERKWPGANPDKRYMFQVFLFYFVFCQLVLSFSLGFNKYLPITIHDATRNRRKWQEKDVGRGSRCICVSSPRCVFFSFFWTILMLIYN